MHAKILLSVLLLGATSVYAQQPAKTAAPAAQKPAAPLTPQQLALQNQLKQVGQQLGQVAAQVAQAVDQNKAGIVWDNASNVAKSVVSKNDFVRQITADRAAVGPVKSRKFAGESASLSDGRTTTKGVTATPAGTYISVAFATQFGTNPQPVRELVSFHLDTDQKWRVSGYTLR
ncbi:MAG TPA: DUF4019 domain-containing protein [Rhodanobacter sp.]